MKRRSLCVAVLLLGWLASGVYLVKGNEQAVIRRFGKLTLPVRSSGLHYDLPWPCTQINRVNLSEVRSVTLGLAGLDALEGNEFLLAENPLREGEFLTGDKNILNLHVVLQYRIQDPVQFLFGTQDPVEQLYRLLESQVADLVARSGVDFVHPLGLNELRKQLTEQMRRQVERHGLGISVEEAAIGGVFPPVRVKAAFLDVSNARAEKDRFIQEAQAEGERRIAQARADARQIADQAAAYRNSLVEQARGSADRFQAVLAGIDEEARRGGQQSSTARQMALRRKWMSALEEILPKLAGKVFLDAESPVDLTIMPTKE